MAIRPIDEYATQVTSGDPGYPHGKARNVTTPGDGTGTPLEEKWVNDLLGMIQAMLASVGATPNGTTERVGASQFLDALNTRFGTDGNLTTEALTVATVAKERTLNVSSTLQQASAIEVSSDGTKMYIASSVGGASGRGIWRYNLSTPWDISTAAYAAPPFVPSQITSTISGIRISPDGVYMYLMDEVADVIHQYQLATPWDITSQVYTTNTLDVTAQTSSPWGFYIRPDGLRIYVMHTGGVVLSYTLTVAWDLSTATYNTNVKDCSSQFVDGRDLVFSADGKRMVCLNNGDALWQYTLTTAWLVSSAVYDGITIDLTVDDANASGLATTPRGSRIYMVGGVGAGLGEVNQYFANRVGIAG